ncbi:hypothetical protein LPMP_241050 [Leishmania panamensis]|uniref:Uncharacterized protein n=1 Tax=Leishmania panamensis TaxID=5679 RepID=A0A088RRZ3_LEIPA|nr:hypothetical protein LPMP_241050 [Leishmania panamensis]AIN98738.1 hypothetical protein LPMP_241050 [Leishmania panamensis]
MPWVPVERVFGFTMQAKVPMGTKTYEAAHQKDTIASAPVSSAASPTTTTLHTGPYLPGSRVRLQLAKTTDIATVVRGTSVLHLLFYAVDESESRPTALAQIALDWRAALTRKGEGDGFLVLLVHSDLIAAAEEASRFAEVHESSGQTTVAKSGSPAPTENAPARSADGSTSPAPAVNQTRVNAAVRQLRKYYKELCDAKFLPQQMCTYMPNETPMRILERLHSAVITHGARLHQALEECAAQKRLSPQDPFTKPKTSAAAKASTEVASLASEAGKVLSTDAGASPPMSPQKLPVGAVSAPLAATPKYWSIQEFWRRGYDLAVHYLQYGLVLNARAVLVHLFLEYYNSSEDYGFVRASVATLQRLGQVPNLFEAHRLTGWAQSKSGYPRGLDTGAELLEGLLVVASAEMTCSLLLGDTAAAMARYHTFMQVTREKFDELPTEDVTDKPAVPPSPGSAVGSTCGAVPLHSATYQQLFLLQCYLSGLRMWWPTSGLCRPRRVGATSLNGATAEEQNSTCLASSISLPLTKLSPSVHRSGNESGMVSVASDVNNDEDRERASEASPRPSSSIVPTTAVTANVPERAFVRSSGTAQLDPLARLDSRGSGVRRSITSPSSAAAPANASGHFCIVVPGLFSGHPDGERSAVRRGSADGSSSGFTAGSVHATTLTSHPGIALEDDADADTMMCDRELNYLLRCCEDTVQVSAVYLVDLATSTGLLSEHMEPEELQGSLQAIRGAVDAGSAQVIRSMQSHQRHLRRSCAEAAALLEHARDALVAIARDLGYSHFSCLASHSNIVSLGEQASPSPSRDNATVSAAAAPSSFASIEELSSPEKALRLWRVLTAMAALTLRIGEQRRREFQLYTQLAMTFLMDHPNVTANIVAERLLPYIKRQGWRRIELFVRRLYVEARQRLMHRAGLYGSCSAEATAGSGDAAQGATMGEPHAKLWLRVFRTSADYALYRECVLILLSNHGECPEDPADTVVGAADCGVPAKYVVGSLDSRLFSARTRTEQWRDLVRVDALVMDTVFHEEPSEYPLEHFTSPLTVKVEHKATAVSAAVSKGDSTLVMSKSPTTAVPGVLRADVDDVVQITFSSVYTINPLVRPAFPAAAGGMKALTREARPAVGFQLTLESRKDWGSDEEATHEVNIRDADNVHYDEQTHRLRVTFTFPICHSGTYLVRRLLLCNGSMWLAYYPQYNIGGSCSRASDWASSLRMAGSHAFPAPCLTHVTVEPLYQPVGRSALLQVPEQRNNVHLRLTLPREAHCFADSVDYVTLNVELEDPLFISAPSATAASAEGFGSVMSVSFTDSRLAGGLAAAPGGQGRAAGGDGPYPTAECTCSFKVSPGSLLLPLAADGTEAHHHEQALRQALTSPLALNSLLPPPEDDGMNSDSSEAHTPPGTPRLVAVVTLGTPNAYRPKSGAGTRSNLAASFSSLSMALSGPGSRVMVPCGGSGVLLLSDSFAARTSQPVEALSLARQGVPSRSAAATTSAGVEHNSKNSPQQQYQSSLPAHRNTKASCTPSELGNRGPVASLSCLSSSGIPGGAPTTPALSSLRKVSEGTLELLLVHSDTAIRDDKNTPATLHRTKTAAAMAVARTVVPIHLSSFLKNLPPPEVHFKTPNKSDAVASGTSVLQVGSYVAADPLRETVIRLFPDTSHTVTPATEATGSEKAGVAVLRICLRLPLLPLLTTPISAEALASKRPETVTSCREAGKDPAPSAAMAANQARIAFTFLRGREPCTTALSVVLPFQAAISFNYVFKHFQGRVYCLVKMKNLLTSTSLWLRGAVLRVLDAEPSYEIVRVCEVYNKLLMTEWKPQEVLSILYELDLIASFRPAQPECTHQVQMEALYSNWHQTFLMTPPEDRLVLCTTEVTAESAEAIQEDALVSATGVKASHGGETCQSTMLTTTTTLAGKAVDTTASTGVLTSTFGTVTTSHYHSDMDPAADMRTVHSASRARSTSVGSTGTRPFTHATYTRCSPSSTTIDGTASNEYNGGGGRSSSSSGVRCQTTASSAVHFNLVTLRHLEETCNTMWGPVAAFHSKHLCVFNIVMYAESPWTMRFGAATNYVAQPPSTSLSIASTTHRLAPLPRNTHHAVAPSHPQPPQPSTNSNFSSGSYGTQLSRWYGSGGDYNPDAGTSLFGNAMVNQPSDFVFVAGEPVRFCVRLQPQAQNWPEEADMEETFFIRLKYNPEQWMVIGKQRDRRTLSLMEEVMVYFNAVPLLPLASADNDTSAAGSSTAVGLTTATSGSFSKAPPRRANVVADNRSDEDMDDVEDVCAATRTGRRQWCAARPLAGQAVKDEGILQTPTVEMFWERKKPEAATDDATNLPMNHFGAGKVTTSAAGVEASPSAADGRPTSADAVMGEPVLVDVVQFRTWVRVRKRGH